MNAPKAKLFIASWCPCSKVLLGTLDAMAKDGALAGFAPDVIDVDRDPEACRAAALRAVPTLIIDRQQGPLTLVGAISRAKLLEALA